MQKLRWLPILMGVTILGITGFQGYWLNNNYDREKQNLEIKTSVDFRQVILQLQSSKLKLEKISLQLDSLKGPARPNVVVQPRKRRNMPAAIPGTRKEPPITMVNLLQEKIRVYGADSGMKKAYIFSTNDNSVQKIFSDSLRGAHPNGFHRRIESVVSTDSFPADPGMTREIKMNKETDAGKIITINYDQKAGKKGKPDSLTVSTSTGIFIEKKDPGLVTEDMFNPGTIPDELHRNAVVQFLYNVD